MSRSELRGSTFTESQNISLQGACSPTGSQHSTGEKPADPARPWAGSLHPLRHGDTVDPWLSCPKGITSS